MAGSFNRYLNKTIKLLSETSGRDAKHWANKATVLQEAHATGLTPLRATRRAKLEADKTLRARVKVGLGGAAAAGTGFLGMHKYYQHQDRKILERIDKMYQQQYNETSSRKD